MPGHDEGRPVPAGRPSEHYNRIDHTARVRQIDERRRASKELDRICGIEPAPVTYDCPRRHRHDWWGLCTGMNLGVRERWAA